MQSIIFKQFYQDSQQYELLLNEILNSTFDSEKGDGFHVIEATSEYIKAVYYYEISYSQSIYNPETGEIEEIKLKRIETVPFFIDYQRHTLDILGNKVKCTRIIEAIGKITKYKTSIADLYINPIKALIACAAAGIQYKVNKVRINDYVFFDDIIGNCVLNLSNYSKTEELLKKYETQIVSFSTTLLLEETYSVVFYKSGAISVYKGFDDIDIEFIRTLKLGL